MSAPSATALSAYRQILRATRIAFRDDLRVMVAARQEARRNFDQNRRVGVDTGMHINHALEVANILRHNIVQGAREGNDESAKWQLRIHDEIERGDNDSIKVGNKDVKIHKACSS
ncbi:Mitochondrial zinc maintenance protein [Penicillium ucsense]|uniref:Mitochondrial zinc maintenance protein 1, mitochondrial n=2 Tax=Penicillium TaxID=5073 RepID=A0A8J8W154_9EURO|nr:Mitochondrial zinc maintenance protein 1 [Penicillium diatomitis]KAF7715455.1 Mitochondrial zinc maintenance protein [Penicillium ucsense]KAF7735145.1 Mitochondrial zinc maintenance protein [Penicillium ucsense]KAJ5469338.1 Mitochondrial zinc maintenance protein 1 [Penicillium diatomitis]